VKDPDVVAALSPRSWGLRARVVVTYLLLLTVILAMSVVALRQFLLVGLEDSVAASLTQEAEQLRAFTAGSDPETGDLYRDDVESIFTDFEASNVPKVAEGSFFLVDGEPFISGRGAPIDLLQQPDVAAAWAAVTAPEFGELDTDAGPAQWLAVPVTTDGEITGTFIATHFLAAEINEIDQAVRLMGALSVLTVTLVSFAGWLIVGGTVRPIGHLTETARKISESELTERIPVRGSREVADLARSFNAMMDRIEKAFTDQRQFLNDVGHELRTPITILRGHIELLPTDAVERDETLALCLDELDRMNRYVTELILLAKSERPDFLWISAVDLAELTRGLLARGSTICPDREWLIDEISFSVIEADPERLTQAWLNLITNAIQHTNQGGTIEIGSSVVDDEARLWVRDNGSGIPADGHDHIFQRFGRGGDTAPARKDGTGLGLSIVAAIAEAHGGRVELTSIPGQGAEFTIAVPVRPPDGKGPTFDDPAADTQPSAYRGANLT
jgi:two-component system OmpR family sensor kinase